MTETAHLDRAAALLLSVGRTALGNIDTGAAFIACRPEPCTATPAPNLSRSHRPEPWIAPLSPGRQDAELVTLAVMQALLGFHQ